MNILFYVLPFVVSIIVIITKKKIVNSQSGKMYAKKELFLDGCRILVVFAISIVANFFVGKNISVWGLVIDIFMMIIYVLPLLQKNYEYIERKALMGIFASCIVMLVGAISVLQMLTGKYDINDPTLFFCFIKGVCYFAIALWCCFTTGKEKKLKSLSNDLMSAVKNYKLNPSDYFVFGILMIFVFTGFNDYFTPVCIFGLHEILNKKKIKGIIYIVIGNLILFLQWNHFQYFYVFHIIYIVVAFTDLIIQYIKMRKNA